MESQRTVKLISCDDTIEAHLIKTRLDDEEIPCFITNENFSNLMPYMKNMMGAGINIMVSDVDYARARDIIQPFTQTDTSPINKECPYCHSTNLGIGLGKNKLKTIIAILLQLLVFIPMENTRVRKKCKNCGEEFDLK